MIGDGETDLIGLWFIIAGIVVIELAYAARVLERRWRAWRKRRQETPA